MNIDYTAAKFWMDISHWVGLVGLAIWGYLRTKDNDNASAVKHVADELAKFIRSSAEANEAQNNRLTIMEETVKHLPTRREQSELREEVAALGADVNGMKKLLQRVEHQTNLIHTHLLNNPR
jgi:Protein of unknown function (DUF2730)